ncbi:MAG: hypothetical protein ACREBC_39315, partial [Pyrinomonadaceae bacterium]
VHIIVKTGGRHIEIQVRSKLQHLWAEYSEKLSDVVDPKVKYGGGPEALSRMLAEMSGMIAEFEGIEVQFHAMLAEARRHSRRSGPEVEQQLRDFRALMVTQRQRLRALLIESIAGAKK